MWPEKWVYLLLIFQSTLSQAPSSQRNNVAPVTTIVELQPAPLITSFQRVSSADPMVIKDVDRGLPVKIEALRKNEFSSFILLSVKLWLKTVGTQENESLKRSAKIHRGGFCFSRARRLYSWEEAISLLVRTKTNSQSTQRLFLSSWNLRNGEVDGKHGARLNIFYNASLNTKTIMPYVILLDTSMVVQR